MKTKKLVITSMLIAIATVLSFIPLIKLPFGGSVTPASMMPVVLMAYLFGVKKGLFGAFVYSLVQLFIGLDTVSAFFLPGDAQMSVVSAVIVCFLDYIVAYTCLGLAGIFRCDGKDSLPRLVAGVAFACIMRYLVHIVSGAVFFGVWADWFFADSTGLASIESLKPFCDWVMHTFSGSGLSVFYSVIYNGAYMIPETIITLIVTPVIYKVIRNKI